MKNIIKIYEALINRKSKICHRKEIIDIIKEYNKKFGKVNIKNTLKYLSRHKYTIRVFKKFYYINSLDEKERKFCLFEDRELLFSVLNKLDIKWYVGLNSALYISGEIWQIPNILTIVNNKISGKKSILGITVRFFKIKESLIFGLKTKKTKNKIKFYYSNPSKTYLDLVYFKQSKKIILKEKTKNYLKRYPKWLKKLI
ncbi:MAG: hypothetical protein WC356_01175 [Candidatus Micrarchaeia archaeon]|jgi:hypothetical protein